MIVAGPFPSVASQNLSLGMTFHTSSHTGLDKHHTPLLPGGPKIQWHRGVATTTVGTPA